MDRDILAEICALISNYRDEQSANGNSIKVEAADEILRRIEDHETKKLNDLLQYLYSNSGEY